MKITKTTKNMAERRGMTICFTERGSVIKDNGVPRDLVAVMLKLNGEHDVRTTNVEDAMVFYSVSKDGSLEFEVGTSICDETMFPTSLSTEAELRASLDTIRKSLNSVVKTVEVPTVHTFPEPLPAIVETVEPGIGAMIIETDYDFNLTFRNDVYCGRFILRDVTRTELHQLHAIAIELVKGHKAYELLQALSVIVSIPERSRNGAITGNRGVEWFSYSDN